MRLTAKHKYYLCLLLLLVTLGLSYGIHARKTHITKALDNCSVTPIKFKDKADGNFGVVYGNVESGFASIGADGRQKFSNNLLHHDMAVAGQITFDGALGCNVDISCPESITLNNELNYSLIVDHIEIAVQQDKVFFEPILCKGLKNKTLSLKIPLEGRSESTIYIGASIKIENPDTTAATYSSKNKGNSGLDVKVDYSKKQ